MKFRSFQHNYHDGYLASFALGPRQELMIEVALDPVWNKKTSRASTSVRFGGISNYDQVCSFFRALPSPQKVGGYIAEIIGVKHLGKGPNWVVIDLADHGHIEVQSQHVIES